MAALIGPVGELDVGNKSGPRMQSALAPFLQQLSLKMGIDAWYVHYYQGQMDVLIPRADIQHQTIHHLQGLASICL